MKLILLITMLYMTNTVWGACSSITRTNSSPNSVLTSTKYNGDLNTVYNFVNAYDGECITTGTIPLDALETSSFSPIYDSLQSGCEVTLSDAATLSVGSCNLGVNGNVVATATSTTVTWGCTSCASEAATTSYYLYAKDGSTGTTLDLLISTDVPGQTGYDSNDNKVLGYFFNDGASDIATASIDQWHINRTIPTNTEWQDAGGLVIDAITTAPTKPTTTVEDQVRWRRVGDSMEVKMDFDKLSSTGGANGSGDYLFKIPGGYKIDGNKQTFYATSEGSGAWKTNNIVGTGLRQWNGLNTYTAVIVVYDETYVRLFNTDPSDGVIGSAFGPMIGVNVMGYYLHFTVPIQGWRK